jgi:trans-aconitate methyltransferase
MRPEVFGSLRLADPLEGSRAWLGTRAVLLRLARSRPSTTTAVVELAALLERAGLWRRPLFYRAALDYAFWAGADAELDPALDAGDLASLANRLRRDPVDLLLHGDEEDGGRETATSPSRNSRERGAFDTLTGAVEERIALAAPARRLRLELVDEVISRFAGERAIRVLDAGCGDGLLSLAISERHPNWEVLGVDLRVELLNGARERASARGITNVRFRAVDITRDLGDADFDIVLAIECLSEIPDDERALETLSAALVPGGLLVVHVPDCTWRAVLPGSRSTWRDQVRQGYGEQQLRDLLQAVKLEEIEIRPTYRAAAAIAQEIRDRFKTSRLAVRASLFPVLAGAAWLDRQGLTAGAPKAFIASGRRQT